VIGAEAARRQAASRQPAPVYLVTGDDERAMASVVDALASLVEDELRAFNVERIYASDKESSPASVVESARIAPMMSAYRVVIAARAEKWFKPRRRSAAESAEEGDAGDVQGAEATGAEPENAGSPAALTPLLEYLKAPVPSTVLVLIASEVNKSVGAVKALYKSANVVECWGLAQRDARPDPYSVVRQGVAEIKSLATAAGRQIEPAAATLLAERSGGDISKLRADLDHVLLFAQRTVVTRADVETVVSDRDAVLDPWAITNAIRDGKTALALRLLSAALDEGAVPYMVLGQLAWFVRERLGEVRPHQVPRAVQAVFRTDLDLKTSGGDPRVLLERLVVELSTKSRDPAIERSRDRG
jgi:DNA polymerase-3 subunit delta